MPRSPVSASSPRARSARGRSPRRTVAERRPHTCPQCSEPLTCGDVPCPQAAPVNEGVSMSDMQDTDVEGREAYVEDRAADAAAQETSPAGSPSWTAES